MVIIFAAVVYCFRRNVHESSGIIDFSISSAVRANSLSKSMCTLARCHLCWHWHRPPPARSLELLVCSTHSLHSTSTCPPHRLITRRRSRSDIWEFPAKMARALQSVTPTMNARENQPTVDHAANFTRGPVFSVKKRRVNQSLSQESDNRVPSESQPIPIPKVLVSDPMIEPTSPSLHCHVPTQHTQTSVPEWFVTFPQFLSTLPHLRPNR